MTTIIDLSISPYRIQNLPYLPEAVKAIVRGVEQIRRYGPQEIIGCNGRQSVFSALGYYLDDRSTPQFVIESMGWQDASGHYGWNPQRGVYRVGRQVKPIK